MELDPSYRERLEALPGVLSHRLLRVPKAASGGRFDARLVLRTKGGSHELLIQQLRSHMSSEMAQHVAGARKASEPVLLLAPHIGSGVAATLIAGGVNYLDASGNCHIVAPPFYVHVEGRTAAHSPDASSGVRGPGFQVLFAYLARPTLLDAPIRTVAELAGVSRQPVSTMKRRLLEEKYIIESRTRTRWHPRRREEALALWLHGYQTTVRTSMLTGVYRAREQTPKDLEASIAAALTDKKAPSFRWGGTAGAFRLTGTYRGERTVVHLNRESFDLARRLGALADPRGNLLVMSAFGLINWDEAGETAHPLLVYSEVLSEGSERAREAAQEVHDRYLMPLWKEKP